MFEILVILCVVSRITGYPDLTPEAITVYRNPDFFKNLNRGTKVNYYQQPAKIPQVKQNYQYPGETKKPNPPPPAIFEVSFDTSPEFQHQPRDIFIDTSYKPPRRKGPYSRFKNQERYSVQEKENSEEEDSKEKFAKSSEDKDFDTILNSTPDEEFKAYHEPILLASPSFDPYETADFASSTYSQPYSYNRSIPISYESWKHYNYPKINSKEYLKVDTSPLYSEESASNAFEKHRYSSDYDPDDRAEEIANFFGNEYKNLGLDTKHIYKKLLSPKKSLSFKIQKNPKHKKLKLKLKKKHSHNANWYDEYPFNF